MHTMPPACVLAGALLLCGCSSQEAPAGPTTTEGGSASGAVVRVLMLTATAGFRHDSIATAVASMRSAGTTGLAIDATEDLSVFSAAGLAPYDVVMFALTSGELPLTADHKSALLEFVAAGRGFVGVHSATDTLYDWPEYGQLVGAYFREHPWTQQAVVAVEEPSHPTTSGLGGSFSILEEFYTFRENPRSRTQVLLRLDAASVGATGDYPLAWAHAFGAGRSYYNALGHFSETWRDPRFQRQMAAALRWAAGR